VFESIYRNVKKMTGSRLLLFLLKISKNNLPFGAFPLFGYPACQKRVGKIRKKTAKNNEKKWKFVLNLFPCLKTRKRLAKLHRKSQQPKTSLKIDCFFRQSIGTSFDKELPSPLSFFQ